MYRQTRFDKDNESSLLEVIPLHVSLTDNFAIRETIFHEVSLWRAFARRILLTLATLTKTLFGNIYVENPYGELRTFSADAKKTLGTLTSQKIISGWRIVPPVPGLDDLKVFSLMTPPQQTINGNKFHLTGATGVGCGVTFDEALYPAVAELIERLSLCDWKGVDLRKKITYEELKKYDRYNLVDEVKKPSCIGVPARDFITEKIKLVPAQEVYINFRIDYDEPFLGEGTSNGSAAHTSLEQAEINAVLELFERDAFLIHWYQKKKPILLNIEGITEFAPNLSKSYEKICNDDEMIFRLFQLDNDFSVTILGGFVSSVRTGVHISLCADICPKTAFKKILFDTIKGLRLDGKRDTAIVEKFSSGNFIPHSLEDRKLLWSQPEMIPFANDFLGDGESVSIYDVIKNKQNNPLTLKDQQHFLRNAIGEQNVRLAIVNVTSTLGRAYNLHVCKAVSPDLIPVFFNELNIPRAVKRLRYDNNGEQVELNPIPHPFI